MLGALSIRFPAKLFEVRIGKRVTTQSIQLKGTRTLNIVPYAISNLLSAAASLLSIILLSRLLTAEAYGYYAMMLALALLGQTTAFTWLQSSIIRLYPEQTDQAGRGRFAQAVRCGFVLSTAFVCIAWAIGLAAFAARLIVCCWAW